MEPSKQQKAIYEKWNTTDNNLLIHSVAGSGKTTTLLELVKLCDKRALFVAFNKSVQIEIQTKLDERGLKQGKALTMHSMGLSSVRANTKFEVNSNKDWLILDTVFKGIRIKWEDRMKVSYFLQAMNTVSRSYLIDNYDDISGIMLTLGNTEPDVKHLSLSKLWDLFKEVRTQMDTTSGKKQIDFTDMIYLPVINDWIIPVYPSYLFIDEVQDLNYCQHRLLDLLIDKGTVKRWAAVGDRDQAIYAFAGSMSSSFDEMKKRDKAIEMPLSVCYRCSRAVIKCANEVYNNLQPFKEELGEVKSIPFDASIIKRNSIVICRNAAPLISLYFRLISMNIPCYIKGNDILNGILRYCKPYKDMSIKRAKAEMHYELNQFKVKMNLSDRNRMKYFIAKSNLDNFYKVSTLLTSESESVTELTNKIKGIFKDVGGDCITLMTIHKSKGLEADDVYILDEDLIPSKFAIGEEQLKQEKNLKYVARTRARHNLYFMYSSDSDTETIATLAGDDKLTDNINQ